MVPKIIKKISNIPQKTRNLSEKLVRKIFSKIIFKNSSIMT